MALITIKYFTREFVQAVLNYNTDTKFVFGDNDERIGYGGQAGACRGFSNCIGIRTKKSPYEYYTDTELVENCRKIASDFTPVFKTIIGGGSIIWPEDGIGTGLAELPIRAPRTYDFLQQMYERLVNVATQNNIKEEKKYG